MLVLLDQDTVSFSCIWISSFYRTISWKVPCPNQVTLTPLSKIMWPYLWEIIIWFFFCSHSPCVCLTIEAYCVEYFRFLYHSSLSVLFLSVIIRYLSSYLCLFMYLFLYFSRNVSFHCTTLSFLKSILFISFHCIEIGVVFFHSLV